MELHQKKISKLDARLDNILSLVMAQDYFAALQQCDKYRTKKKTIFDFVYGHILILTGKKDEGCNYIEKPLFKTVKDPYCLYRLAHLAFEAEYYADAITCYERAIVYEKDFWEASYNLGNAYKKLKKFPEAKRAYERALKVNPLYVDMKINLAQVFEELREIEKAKEIYSQALEIEPRDCGILCGLARCSFTLEGEDVAKDYWNKALEINPKFHEAHDGLINTPLNRGEFEEAQKYLDIAVEAGVEHETLFLSMARILYMGQKNIDLARQVLEQGVEFYPDVPELWTLLIGIMLEKAEYEEVENKLNSLFEAGMDYWYLKLAKTRLLFETARIDEAEQVVEGLIKDNPYNGIYISSLLALMAYNSRHTPEELFKAHVHYAARLEEGKEGVLEPRSFSSTSRKIIKVGYVSPDFKDHATSRFMEPTIANHDRDKFHITLYSHNKMEDRATERFKKHADDWCNTMDYSDYQLARKIQEDEIDVLVDLAGHTPGNRLGAFAFRPAPLQISWMGYPFTTGMKSIDYYLTNSSMTPLDKVKYFVEKVEYIESDHSGGRPTKVSWLPDGVSVRNDMPLDTNGYFTFGCFNRVEKLSDNILEAWAEILLNVPNSKLLLKNRNFDNSTFLEKYRNYFIEKGIDERRLIFQPSSKLKGYLNTFNQVDVVLDTYPYNASTVSNDSLKMGVPYITLSGETTHSRVGASFLENISFDHFVTYNLEDYVALAIKTAGDTQPLRDARQFLYERTKDEEYDITIGPLEETYTKLLNQVRG